MGASDLKNVFPENFDKSVGAHQKFWSGASSIIGIFYPSFEHVEYLPSGIWKLSAVPLPKKGVAEIPKES